MKSIGALGTQIRFEDGREATVVFNSLIGVGAKWGLHNPDPADFENTSGGLVDDSAPPGFQWQPDILLRAPWGGNARCGFTDEQCICLDFDVLRYGLGSD